MIEVDARGLSCPEPMLMATDAVRSSNGEEVRVLVSSATARDNVRNVARKAKREAVVEELGADFAITIR
ncbi:sulfurtransferase TusA family protein [Adlercreutzia sp. ZJ473]|uniref:sulfurtransferase TusA family protein n=1 Tax=Adlercreutzia sp. ZJ473 TaxID=2722822 RepID=UPI0015552CF6|nr:sulfurtransferase TusA family protein [Adlercreutzia sp. ZJ473]